MDWNAGRSLLWVGFVGLLIQWVGAAPLESFADSAVQESDVSSALHARVQTYEDVWNTHDASELAGFFEPDADMIMGNGPRIVGREAIRDWWAGYFDRIAEGRKGSFTIVSERRIADNVALLNVDSTTAGGAADGQELPTRRARGTWVVVLDAGEWLIAAMRGQPAEGEFRSSPGTDKEPDRSR